MPNRSTQIWFKILEFKINQIFEISDPNCCEDDTAWGGNCPKWNFDVWKVGVGTVTVRVHDLYANYKNSKGLTKPSDLKFFFETIYLTFFFFGSQSQWSWILPKTFFICAALLIINLVKAFKNFILIISKRSFSTFKSEEVIIFINYAK